MFDLNFISVNWWQVLSHLSHLLVAYALALPIGLDRQMSERHFGLRTFPLVAVVSCGFMLVGMEIFQRRRPRSVGPGWPFLNLYPEFVDGFSCFGKFGFKFGMNFFPFLHIDPYLPQSADLHHKAKISGL